MASRNEDILNSIINKTEYDKPTESRMEELLLQIKELIESGGSEGGATSYTELEGKPQINGVTLIGNKTTEELKLQPSVTVENEVLNLFYTKSETDTRLEEKADLINGTVPVSQIPSEAIEQMLEPITSDELDALWGED